MEPAEPADAIRYSAFLSYSRHDARQAEWLQRGLETYRLPRSLRGPSHARPLPVFRDMSELTAAPDLEIELKAALSASAHLIVLCSPEAAASRWVNREIELFRKLHPDRPVLAALCSGDETISFPPALRQSTDDGQIGTPLAADLRREHGGRRLALIKLVARLANVGLDKLIQRDAQRRHQQTLGIAAAGLLLAAVLLGLLVQAIRAQREAERQRAAAESLIEFMIGDLRAPLEKLGKLSILDAIGARALDYYQHQSDGGPDSLARRARVLSMVGEIQSQQGNIDVALENFRAAADSTGRLLALAPNDPKRIYNHAQSVFYVGAGALAQRRLGDAQKALEDYRDLAERLVRLDPLNPKWQPEPGYASSNLGTVLLERGRNQSAEPAFRRALAISETAARKAPNDQTLQHDLAQSYAWLADTLERLDRQQEALASRRAEQAIYRRILAADADDRQALSRLINSVAGEARIVGRIGSLDIAIKLAISASQDAELLFAKDNSNAGWNSLYFSTLIGAAEIALLRDESSSAKIYLARAANLLKIMAKGDEAARRRAAIKLLIARSTANLEAKDYVQAAVDAEASLQLIGSNVDLSDRSFALASARSRLNLLTAVQHTGRPLPASEVAELQNIISRFEEFDTDIRLIRRKLTNLLLADKREY